SSKGGKARSEKYDDKRKQATLMVEQGVSKAKIAKMLGVSRRTIINWINRTTGKE
ncbi:helix-turn-helix domain-containing protein, partial [Psychrobacter sp. AOP5-CZ1-12]|uniref:helix-turn-helix domain-containing protein n=1 Tax=Psychrobacter sp. AOP5-CZ1-12 TaxID=3457651 RepID=UPI00402B6E9F